MRVTTILLNAFVPTLSFAHVSLMVEGRNARDQIAFRPFILSGSPNEC